MPPQDAPPPDPAQRLCLDCGLCCQGLLCPVILTPDERALYAETNTEIRPRTKGDYYFSHPCPHLQPEGCNIYIQRPADCQHFRCRLLKRLIEGTSSLGVALAQVQQTREMSAALMAKLPDSALMHDPNTGLQDALRHWLKQDKPQRNPALLKQVRQLLGHLEETFHPQSLLKQLPSPKSALTITLRRKSPLPQEQANKNRIATVRRHLLENKTLSTPALVIDGPRLAQVATGIRALTDEGGAHLLYSMKANAIFPLVEKLATHCDGITCSSLPELQLARKAAGPDKPLHYTTPAITEAQIDTVTRECSHIHFNALSQWDRFHERAAGTTSCGLRVNPHISLVRRPHYDPCRPFSKLGVSVHQLQEAWQENPSRFEALEGLHLHNAAGQRDYDHIRRTAAVLEERLPELLKRIRWLNLGGGYRFDQHHHQNRHILLKTLAHLRNRYNLELYLEPGTALVRKTCWLVATVVDLYESEGKPLAILDSSINHQLESFIYGYRTVVYGTTPDGPHRYQLAGATCLAGDLLGEHRFDEPLCIGSRILFENVGAYTHAFTIQYNGLPPPTLYWMQEDGDCSLVKRFTLEDFLERAGG
ncbi:MAG: YkgJ family cysteine cluster protein [Magnetococcales bacterium]|nr:YkgJ family cysteine cluster protein [Magnetococcales bacterium]